MLLFPSSVSKHSTTIQLSLTRKGGTIPLHISAQNTGVLISKVNESLIHFEAFELSPLNEAVVSTKGRLRRSFPGPALSLAVEEFNQSSFQAMVAQTLSKMSFQQAAETLPTARKAGQLHAEDRDTAHPKIVTELFWGLLRSHGQAVDVSRIWKNTREEVMYFNARSPWHRSPMWLLIRVAMQLVFSRSAAHLKIPGDLYKYFMVFFMSHVLGLSHQHYGQIPKDLTYAMNAKIARRLIKIDQSGDRPGPESLDCVETIMRNTSNLLDTTWTNIRQKAGPHWNLSDLVCLDFGADAFYSLSSLDEQIKSIAQRTNISSSALFEPEPALIKFQSKDLPTHLFSGTTEYTAYNLAAFESWVASNLSIWLQLNKSDVGACGKLDRLVQRYFSIASNCYSGDVETTSMMLLTILELWIACDESATHICNLLSDYDPGIPKEIFQSLVLPFKSQMERLLRAEDYLERRRARAIYPAPSIFRDFGQAACFSARYFNNSPDHQQLLREIQTLAYQAKEKKCNELRQIQEKYRSLMKLYDQSECEYYDVVTDSINDFRETRHSGSCMKCAKKSQAAALSIRIYEWPLPRNTTEAQSAVFELKVPPYFGHWRDITVFFLLDILKVEYASKVNPRSNHPLKDYVGLRPFFTEFSTTQRIHLLSQNKPQGVTHRRDKDIPIITESDVCLPNGLRYEYHDRELGCFVGQFNVTDKIPQLCVYKLPIRSSSLQQFIFRPASMPNGPSPNTVIASQSECPDHMSLDECKTLSTIPLGYWIQWQNMLLQLSMPSVDFKKVETGLVFLQSLYQAGPPIQGSTLRAGHEIVSDDIFANKLLEALEVALKRVKENWESSQALSTFISMATRLLSLTSTVSIQSRCLGYLMTARAVAFEWVSLLKDKAQKETSDDCRTDLLSKAVEIALICVDSFNIDEIHLKRTLCYPKEASVLLQCSIIIHEGNYTISNASDSMIRILHRRWKVLSYRSYPIMAEQILEYRSESLDDAIKKSWAAYHAGDGWEAVSTQADHWLVSETSRQGDSDSLRVHFNLMNGELLVNGHPLDRLPLIYERHPTYRVLFGNSALEVMPTAVPGMQFSGKKDYAGYTLHFGFNHFGFKGEDDLLIQATKDGRKYELIPSWHFRDDFPIAFVNDFVHWYDVNHDFLEFRPAEDPWATSPHNWKLTRDGSNATWSLTKDRMSLVGAKSETAKALSNIFSPLEHSLRTHFVFHHLSSSLEIELPRLQLGFTLESRASSIKSRQFRGMFIDPDQSLDTLVGLESKLILKHDKNSNRLVIVPEGSVSHRSDGDHIRVSIDKDSATKAHSYHVDRQLGRLIDNGSLQSQLLLCYLHALTSFCLPDPLLLRTGTEQALLILNSAAVRSFDQLEQENIDILHQIAQLTPERSYYPAHERVMQTVNWCTGLGFLAQHGGFYKSVKSIFKQAEGARVFHPESDIVLPALDKLQPDLLERDCIRSSTFRVSGFGAEDHTIDHDEQYPARDRNQNSVGGVRAFVISSTIHHGRNTFHYNVPSNLRDQLWAFLSRTSVILGPAHPLPLSPLNYDATLLLDPPEFLSLNWIPLQKTLSQESSKVDKSRLMIWLSTLAFAKNADMYLLQTLASFFTVPGMAQIPAPQIASFRLRQGRELRTGKLQKILQPSLLSIHRSPEAQLPTLTNKSRKRRQSQFQSNQTRTLNGLISALEFQWPCEVPNTPVSDGSVNYTNYIDVDRAMQAVKPQFKTWFENYRFYKYLGQITKTLENQRISPMMIPTLSFLVPKWNLKRKKRFISVNDVLAFPTPSSPTCGPGNRLDLLSCATSAGKAAPRLSALIDDLHAQAGGSKFEMEYAEDLRRSHSYLRSGGDEYELRLKDDVLQAALSHHLKHCKENVQNIYQAIFSALSPRIKLVDSSSTQINSSSAIAAVIGQWPRLSPTFFLRQLNHRRSRERTRAWDYWFVQYGLALTELQQAERLVSLSGNPAELIKELRNPGHENWSPIKHPESLLLEVESGIMIRDVQEQIAEKMRHPPDGQNAVMQLNMGEGKSSVVIPITATSLADGSRLVRVIVAKPQAKQMLQMLVSKLGGMLDRRVYHMPFSRALKLTEEDTNAIGDMYRECMANGGILLVQPEHILSFKLMGLECLITGKEAIGKSLLKAQAFFDESSRDLVDESDENFSVKFELIYTMGMQHPIESSPERWVIIQQVLNRVRMFAPDIMNEFPISIEVDERRPGSFPRTRVLRPDAGQEIFRRVATHICETNMKGFPIARQPKLVRDAVFVYITEPSLTADEIARVENPGPRGFWTDATSSTLLLLRGLLAGGVLAFAFGQKRWRVNYGLDANRKPKTKLAVPYRAKDNATPRSEFSHPDVVIVLTSLSYYYGGLTNDDLFLAFAHLLKSDQADDEYQAWVNDAPALPPAFRQLVGINLKDRFQCIKDIFPSFKYAKSVVDYFLAHIVFPKEIKEFPHKLSASGWDIGQVKQRANTPFTKGHPTTGFSGTNDSRKVLPLSVEHLDLPEQKHTNALVLEYLLQPENTVKLMPPRDASGSDAERLLTLVKNMKSVRVILDVGAQILELSNLEVAQQWLGMMSDLQRTQAVVFFSDRDELSVLDRKGNIEPLQISSFAKQLDVCLVFLDEAHTRGTDLQLPADYRAAVTLGPNLTKDRLVQGKSANHFVVNDNH